MASFSTRWQLLAGEVTRQASGFLQDKYKQARLALGDVTPAELLVQEATNNDACVPDAKTLACIADAAFDMDDYWRIASVLHQRLGRVDWKEWRPVYKALVVLEFLLTHGPDELPRDFLPDMPALCDLRSFNYTDDRGVNWGACMQRRTDAILALLTDADRLKDARRRAIRVSHEVHHGFAGSQFSPTATTTTSSSPSSATSSRTSRTWSFGSDSPGTLVCLSVDADYRHDKKFDAYTADDDWSMHLASTSKAAKWWPPATVDEDDDIPTNQLTEDDDPANPIPHSWDARFEDTTAASLSLLPQRTGSGCCNDGGAAAWPARFCSRMFSSSSSRASGFQSLSQPERRTNKKLQRQLSLDY